MDIINIIITIISGVIGGNVAGAAMPDKSLGAIGNSVTGLLGGGLGNILLQALGVLAMTGTATATGTAPESTAFDISTILANIATSGVGGAALTAIVAFIKDAIEKKN